MDDNAIQVKDLHKTYGDLHAVQGISFDVLKGEIFSLLGPNGAGKSTTISMLSCLLKPTQGEAWVMSHSNSPGTPKSKRGHWCGAAGYCRL